MLRRLTYHLANTRPPDFSDESKYNNRRSQTPVRLISAQPLRHPISAPAPLAPQTLVHADRLQALRAQRCQNLEQRQSDYVALMEQLGQDPAVLAIWQWIVDGATPHAEYFLGFGLFVNSRGLEAVIDTRGRIDISEVRQTPAHAFAPSSVFIGTFKSMAEAVPLVCQKIAEISDEIIDATGSGPAH
jgi:hypothetical protein